MPADHPAYEIHGEHRKSRWLVTCDHASNQVPHWVNGGDLGLPSEDMNRHIAYDVGAAGLSRHLSDLLVAPAILSRFSRLVIDPNRGEDDPTLLMRLYDGTIIPANRNADDATLQERKAKLYSPYHDALAHLAARQDDSVICAVHSFTPELRGRKPRPWHVGILYSHLDERLSVPVVRRLEQESDLCVGANEPYSGHLPGDAIDRHALRTGRNNILIEVRNDLIGDEAGQRYWAERLAPILVEVLRQTGL